MPTILGANTLSTGFDVQNSLRFDKASSAYLNNTPSSDGSTRKLTFSVWFKKADPANTTTWNWLIHNGDASDGTPSFGVGLKNDKISIIDLDSSGSYDTNLVTNEELTDVSAWYHIFVAIDTTQGTDTNRVKVYLNGSQITSFATAVYPGQNHDFNTAPTMDNYATEIGRDNYGGGEAYFDGYMCEMVLLDGTAGDISDFGEFDSDTPTVWKPKKITGQTFGTNGFHLEFKQTGTSANSSGIGADTSGVDRHFAVNNLAATDQSIDTCTNNYATMNPLDNAVSAGTFSEGNLKISYSGSNGQGVALTSTIAVTQGKWYFEVKLVSTNDTGNAVGITDINAHSNAAANRLGLSTYSYAINDSDGQIYNNNSGSSYGSSFGAGDIMGVYLDLDNNKLYISENGTLGSSTGKSITAPASVTDGHYFFAVGVNSGSATSVFECNFGGTQTYSISSAVSDDNGHGNFEYSPNITGDGAAKKFYALNTKNLAEFG